MNAALGAKITPWYALRVIGGAAQSPRVPLRLYFDDRNSFSRWWRLGLAMGKSIQAIELTTRDIELLLKYACPFPEHAELLRQSQASGGWHTVHVDTYWISMWIGDLVYSAQKIRGQSLLDEIDALCTVLESAETRNQRA